MLKQGTTREDIAKAQELPAAKGELRKQGTTPEDIAKTQMLPAAKEELLKQGKALEDITEAQKLPAAKVERLKQGTMREDIAKAQKLPRPRWSCGSRTQHWRISPRPRRCQLPGASRSRSGQKQGLPGTGTSR